MNSKDLETWRNAIDEHQSVLKSILQDRRELKELMEKHLLQFFPKWDSIEFSNDFSKITIELPNYSEVDAYTLSRIGMECGVSSCMDSIQVIVYPFWRD